MVAKHIGVRRSIRELEQPENKALLDAVVTAWDKVQKLPPNDENSFFRIGGYHGEPFEYRPAVDNLNSTDAYWYWGGWCHHGNVLFPVWHRAYLHRLEKALQAQVPGVMMPYWDETSEETIMFGIPKTLTDETYTFADGREIPNPLKSFTIPVALKDDLKGPLGNQGTAWAKPAGYTTVRYPFSGLVGSADARKQTALHNLKYEDLGKATEQLNRNVIDWIVGPEPEFDVFGKLTGSKYGIDWRYTNCLNAPNYTVFSNITSAAAWNRENSTETSGFVSPLEDPHNSVHLAVGGFDYNPPGTPLKEIERKGIIAGANGDMGENNTAGLDPIFFLHHANVDRMFFLWQQKHGKTTKLDIPDQLKSYPGTDSSDNQGPTPGIPPGTTLSMDTPLLPFFQDDPQFGVPGGEMRVPVTGNGVVDTKKLGYTYSMGSLDVRVEARAQVRHLTIDDLPGYVRVYGIDRAHFEGSFVMHLLLIVGNDRYHLGAHAALSRRDILKCANCLTHLEVEAAFPLPNALRGVCLNDAQLKTVFMHRGPTLHPDVAPKYEIVQAN